MIKSMTAFGRAKSEAADKEITVEIRSVNSRYFDCTVKAPRTYLVFEEKIKAFLQKGIISRGKVDVYVTVDHHESSAVSVSLDGVLAKGYIEALRTLSSEFSLPNDITTMAVARNQDLFTYARASEDEEAEWARLLPVLAEAAAEFSERREAEGARTEEDIREKLAKIEGFVKEIEALSLADKGQYREKLENRIRTLLGEADIALAEDKILTEVALYADRIAVDEEIARLRSHFAAFFEIASSKEPSGRRLDFLMQEMNRETNTIGSKASNSTIAHLVVSIKGELEKIREQVQNIE